MTPGRSLKRECGRSPMKVSTTRVITCEARLAARRVTAIARSTLAATECSTLIAAGLLVMTTPGRPFFRLCRATREKKFFASTKHGEKSYPDAAAKETVRCAPTRARADSMSRGAVT